MSDLTNRLHNELLREPANPDSTRDEAAREALKRDDPEIQRNN